MSNIGEKIKELRTESGTTQLQLGGYATLMQILLEGGRIA